MKGADLSEGLFRDLVLPVLERRFPEHAADVSAAAVGMGSEVLGYDDPISRDHNFTPGVTLFLPDGLFDRVGEAMVGELRRMLPAEYAGVPLLWTGYASAVRVHPLPRYFPEYLGLPVLPRTDADWLRCDEQKLLELTAGRVYHDPRGLLGEIRRALRFYPPAVRLHLLRLCFIRMSEAKGVERSCRRGDWIATQQYLAFFVRFAIRSAHLLAGRYCPYQKWMGRSLREIGPREAALHGRLESLVRATSLAPVRNGMLEVLSDLGTRVCKELGVSPPGVVDPGGLTLLPFDWDAVLEPLSRRLPEELRGLPPLVSPPAYLGQILDYTGYDATYEELLESNLGFIRRVRAEPLPPVEV